jgi:hypothetical protein
MLRKFGIIAVLSLLVTAFAAVPALAQEGAHFTRNGEPVCTITGSGATATVNCTSELAGLGNEDIISSTTVSGFAVYQCQNPGGNLAPGQNRVLEGPVTTPVTIPADSIKNGRATVPGGPTTLTAAPTVSGRAAGCPNGQWTGVNPTLTITSVTFSATQGDTLLFTSTASNPAGLTGTFSPTVTGGVAA